MNQNLLSEKVLGMHASATIKMSEDARELREQGHDVISLSLGEPDFDTPDHIKEAAKKALDEGYTKYTPVPGLLELRQAIVQKFKRDNGLAFSPSQIVVSNGAKQCIANLCLALLDPGDEVVIFAPYWVSYRDIVSFVGGVPVPVYAGIESDFKVSAQQVEAAISDKTKMILFSSPCNPTGSVYLEEELQKIAEVIDQYPHLVVVSDEIYEHINFTKSHFSIGTIDSIKDRTVTVNGMAKGFAMTGWRLGYMGGPEWLAKACAKVQGQFTSGANAFGQRAAIDALLGDMTPSLVMKKAFLKRKKFMVDALSKIDGFQCNNPKGAFYIFPNISEFFGKSNGRCTIENSADFATHLLHEQYVAVVAGAAFGAPNCIRISYAASDEQLKIALERIERFASGFNLG